MLKLHPVLDGFVVEQAGRFLRPRASFDWDMLFTQDDPLGFVQSRLGDASEAAGPPPPGAPLIQSQEIWAAGVTYWRSRTARMSEAKDAGGGTFYDKVYSAERPELFFKATAHRVAPPGGCVRLRSDSRWNVPEPELSLAINARGVVFGYTIGNDMSSRDIEGENPLYLPQAKVYDQSAALGPCLLLTSDPLPAHTGIAIEIRREGMVVFNGSTEVGQIKRTFASLAEFLFRENRFPHGCYLMTGTGIVPPDDFTLRSGDEIRITIDPIGTLINSVA